MRRLTWIAVGLSLVFLATFAIGMALGFLQPDQVERWVTGLSDGTAGKAAIAALVFALMAGDLVLAVPSAPLMAVAGHELGPWIGGAVSAAGAMAAVAIGYFACRWGGQRVFGRWVRPAEAARARVLFDRYGLLAVLLVRGLPILPEVMACMGGLVRLPAGRFMAAYAIATVPWALLHTLAGYYSSWTNPWPALLVIFGLPIAAWTIARRVGRSDRRQPQEEAT